MAEAAARTTRAYRVRKNDFNGPEGEATPYPGAIIEEMMDSASMHEADNCHKEHKDEVKGGFY